MSRIHVFSMYEPWFHHIVVGNKSVEGRCGAKYQDIQIGDIIEFVSGSHSARRKVTLIKRYDTFREMLSHEHLASCLPEVETIEQGITIHENFYCLAKQNEFGVVALHFV